MKKVTVFIISILISINFCFASNVDERSKIYTEKITANEFRTKQIIFRLLGLDKLEEPQEEITYDGSVYLTFDDGPVADITPAILDVLKEYNVKATFFDLGSYINRNPEITKRVYEEGHEVANHSYTHRKEMFSSIETFKSEIEKTNKAISDATGGYTPKFFRVPYGTKLKEEYTNYLKQQGFEIIGWNCESYDSRGSKIKAADMLKGVKDTMKNNKKVIVIMHDTYGKEETVKALPSIIEYFQSINYEFKKIGQ